MKKIICLFAFAIFYFGNLVPANALEAMYGLTGLYVNEADAYEGYTLFAAPDGTTYLIDMDGRKVHSWKLPSKALYSELLPNGNLLSACEADNMPWFGGKHGHLVEQDWNGKIVWEAKLNTDTKKLHHGFDRMPNGNTLALGWEQKSWDAAKAKGRKDVPSKPIKSITKKAIVEGIWPDVIYEFDKKGNIVWEWHAWDNIGKGADKLDINFTLPKSIEGDLYHYPDWTHFNSVRYNEKTDQILISSRQFSEVMIIDKKSGKIVWRYGNPGTHGAGELPSGYGLDGDQVLFGNHDANWLENGNIAIFENGTYRPSGAHSRVIELNPKNNKVVWSFGLSREFPNGFYAAYQSSAQKLPNDNYLVATTPQGHIFEVTPTKEIVWEYMNPIAKDGPLCISGNDGRTFRIHRAFRYAKDYAGLKGNKLKPGKVLNPGCPEMAPLLKPYL